MLEIVDKRLLLFHDLCKHAAKLAVLLSEILIEGG